MMTYEAALAYIHSICWRGSRPGLSRVTELCALLGNPQDSLRFVHVAGTNGKGSVCTMLATMYRHAGYRTGLFTSPYVYRFNERMAVDGQPITDEELAQIIGDIRPLADGMADPPTEFELITAAAFVFFARRACDVVILETGLGGRLDSTNIIKRPLATVITGIGLDHTAQLGGTHAAIAAEKAGIMKAGCPAVLGCDRADVQAVVQTRADAQDVPLTVVDFHRLGIHSLSLDGTRFTFDGQSYTLGLLGHYQPTNAAIAITAAKVLGLPPDSISYGVAHARWPARFELLRRQPPVLFDGGHNPHGIAGVVASVKVLFPEGVDLLTGVMADKDYPTMIAMLSPCVKRAVCITPDNDRALPAVDYAAAFRHAGVEAQAADSIGRGVELALAQCREDGRPLLIAGSLYMYRDVRDALESVGE